MNTVKAAATCALGILMLFSLAAAPAWSGEDYYKIVTHSEFDKYKRYFDDPRPIFKDWSWKKIMPAADYAKIVTDPEAAKALWAEIVGFKAPDVVGKIAPEIKPGKYSYKDKEKYPGIKALMVPSLYEMFKQGAPPLAGSFPEIEIVPTREYYYNAKIGQATRENAGRTKLDGKGYIINETYASGFPFPRPAGQFKAQEYMYNWNKNYNSSDDSYGLMHGNGFSRNLKPDYETRAISRQMRLQGRAVLAPFGWYDERAKARNEFQLSLVQYYAPRDRYGDAIDVQYYAPAQVYDNLYMYAGAIRRVRKMSNTDTQDAVGGSDYCYEDAMGFSQKMSPIRYPYKYEVVGEREYLFPYTLDGSDYITSKGAEWRNLQFERRPVVVLKLTELDRNFVYSARIFYIDKETFQILHTEMYDQKGRFYRSYTPLVYFDTATGLYAVATQLIQDHVDLHATINRAYTLPITRTSREVFDLTSMAKTGR